MTLMCQWSAYTSLLILMVYATSNKKMSKNVLYVRQRKSYMVPYE